MISAELVRECLSYDRETGIFTWIKTSRTDLIGTVAGRLDSRGYRQIYIGGRRYMAQQLAWLFVYGTLPKCKDIDHENRIRDDNWIANLRSATRAENISNSALRKDNTTGARGVRREGNRYRAVHARKSLGSFATIECAAAAYNRAVAQRFGDFVR